MTRYSIESVYREAFSCLFLQLRDANVWWNTTLHYIAVRQENKNYWKTFDKEFEQMFNETREILRDEFNYDFGEDYQNNRRIRLKHPQFIQEINIIELPSQFSGTCRTLYSIGIEPQDIVSVTDNLDRGAEESEIRLLLQKVLECWRLVRTKTESDYSIPDSKAYDWVANHILQRWELYRTRLETPETAKKNRNDFFKMLKHHTDLFSESKDASLLETALPECEEAKFYLPYFKEKGYKNLSSQDLTTIHANILNIVAHRLRKFEQPCLDDFREIYFDVLREWFSDDYCIEEEKLNEATEIIWKELSHGIHKNSS